MSSASKEKLRAMKKLMTSKVIRNEKVELSYLKRSKSTRSPVHSMQLYRTVDKRWSAVWPALEWPFAREILRS